MGLKVYTWSKFIMHVFFVSWVPPYSCDKEQWPKHVIKENIFFWSLKFQKVTGHDYHGGEHSSMQAAMVLEKELSLHLLHKLEVGC